MITWSEGADPHATLTRVGCEECDGTGELETMIGGDGYGNRCAGLADVPVVCWSCEGRGWRKRDRLEVAILLGTWAALALTAVAVAIQIGKLGW